MNTRVLALNAYHGGSHQAFLEGWVRHSRHHFTLLTLPAYKWKWRMRHAAVTFAEQVATLVAEGHSWDVLFCTDMLNLAEFLGLCPPAVQRLPAAAYFHENQLTYPDPASQPRDLHFAFTNLTTAMAARRVWFNSSFHRDEFLTALDRWLNRMPDFGPRHVIETLRSKSEIQAPGIELPDGDQAQCGPPLDAADETPDSPGGLRAPLPGNSLRILWVSRWEHDKDPETFFQSLFLLQERGCNFRLSVLGERFGRTPEIFDRARVRLAEHVDHWGYLPEREAYRQTLSTCDTVVSTARHEFFGIAILEAVAAGCLPLVPRRLAYPEVLGDHEPFFHDGTASGLASRLAHLAERKQGGPLRSDGLDPRAIASRFGWQRRALGLDEALERVVQPGPHAKS